MQKFNNPGDIHFVTFRTYKKYPYFKDEKCCLILLEELNYYRTKFSLKIYGYVILPDHIHCLIYFEDEDLTISRIVQAIKGFTARRIIKLYSSIGSWEQLLPATRPEADKQHFRKLKYKIWQPDFYDFNVQTDKKFWEKLEYIHNNPIKHRLTDDISKYKFCSWRNYELNDHSIFKIDYCE